MKFEEVEKYLRLYSSDIPPYDVNGAIYLLKAIVDNLQENIIEDDLETFAEVLDRENASFLKSLVSTLKNN